MIVNSLSACWVSGMLASLSGIKSAYSYNKPRCFVNTLLFMKWCYVFLFPLHPSQTGISHAVPSREQRQAGTDIVPWTAEYPHAGYTPGKKTWAGPSGLSSYVQTWCLGSSPSQRTTAVLGLRTLNQEQLPTKYPQHYLFTDNAKGKMTKLDW